MWVPQNCTSPTIFHRIILRSAVLTITNVIAVRFYVTDLLIDFLKCFLCQFWIWHQRIAKLAHSANNTKGVRPIQMCLINCVHVNYSARFWPCISKIAWIRNVTLFNHRFARMTNMFRPPNENIIREKLWTSNIFFTFDMQCPTRCEHDKALNGQDGLTTLTKRRFGDLPLQNLEFVRKLGPPCQSHQMQIYRYWTGSAYHWKSGRFHIGRKRC